MRRIKAQKWICFAIVWSMLLGLIPIQAQAAFQNSADDFIAPIEPLIEVPIGYVGIYQASDFDNIRNNPSGKYILMSHIDLSQYNHFTPIGVFSGILDGNGYYICGLKQNFTTGTEQLYSGLVEINTGTIKNLGVQDGSVTVETTSGVAFGSVLAAVNQGSIENCVVSGTLSATVQTPNITVVGAICAYNKGEISKCHSISNITAFSGAGAATQLEVGGIAGENSATVTSCVNSGTIDITNENGTTFGAGVVGRTLVSIQDCGNMANVFVTGAKGAVYCGGITGRVNGSGCTILRCFNYGHIQATVSDQSAYAGGIAGAFSAEDGTTTSEQNYNEGSVTAGAISSGSAAAGGIAGVLQGYYHIANSYNNGAIRADSAENDVSAGGIAGDLVQNISYGTIKNCYNTGTVASSDMKQQGGIVGRYRYAWVQISDTIQSSYSINNDSLLGTASSTVIIDDSCGNYANTPDAFTKEETFTGWDFETVWTMDDKQYPYPSLKNNLRMVDTAEEDADFNVLHYRAKMLTEGTLDIAKEPYSYYAFENKMGTCEPLIYDTVGLDAVYRSWNVLKDAVAALKSGGLSIVKGEFQEKDIYGAILLELLQCDSNLRYIKGISDSTALTYTNEISARVGEVIRTKYHVTDAALYYQWLKEHQQEGAEIIGACMKTYGADPSTDYKYYETSILQVAEKTDYIRNILEMAGSLENAVNQFVSFTMLLDMSESMKAIISSMNEQCELAENIPLKMALSEIERIISATTEEEINRILSGEITLSIGINGLTWVYSNLWNKIFEEIKLLHPWMAFILALYQSGEWVIDQVLADEQFYRMHAILDIENLANNTLQYFYNQYKQSPSQWNAAIFLDMVEIKSKILAMDNAAAYDYVDKAVSLENWKETISKNTELARDVHFQLDTAWLHALLGERPELIRNYTGFWIAAWKECFDRYPDYYLDDDVDYTYLLSNRYTYGELIEIACPVNVYIYDESDNMVAYAVDGKVYTAGTISVIYEDGVKRFYITDNNAYRVVCEGYDKGEMDIKLTQYQQNAVERVAYFQNIMVSDASSHVFHVDASAQDQQLYLETSSDVIAPSYDSKNHDGIEYHVVIENGYLESDGLTSYDCQIQEGTVVKLTSVIADGYRFVKWTSSIGDDVFNDPQNPFCMFTMPSSDIIITAVMEPTVVTKPVITPLGGVFDECQRVEITCATEGAVIYYTTDGSEPMTSSNRYQDPVVLTETTTIKAMAVKTGMENSEVVSATFQKQQPSIVDVTVRPSPITVEAGGFQQFTAQVTGNGIFDHTVTWSLEGESSADTNISATGLLEVSPAEISPTITVKATANGDHSKVGTAHVTIAPMLLGEIAVNGNDVKVIAQAPDGTTLYAASYDANGKMLDVATATVTAGKTNYTLSLAPGASVQAFLLDQNQLPLCQAKTIQIP